MNMAGIGALLARAAAVFLLVAGWTIGLLSSLLLSMPVPLFTGDVSLHDTYYVIASPWVGLVFGGAFTVLSVTVFLLSKPIGRMLAKGLDPGANAGRI